MDTRPHAYGARTDETGTWAKQDADNTPNGMKLFGGLTDEHENNNKAVVDLDVRIPIKDLASMILATNLKRNTHLTVNEHIFTANESTNV